MASHLLNQRADLVTVSEALDPSTRRPVETPTTVATGLRAAAVKRSDRTILFDPTGETITDHDVILEARDGVAPPVPGDRIVVTGPGPNGSFLVTGEARHGVNRRTSTVHHYTVPARRVDV